MATAARHFASFDAALKTALEEEISGETYFAAMADAIGGKEGDALRLMAAMERETVRLLTPVAARAGIVIADQATLRAEGRAEGLDTARRGWDELVRDMSEDFGAYVEEFLWLRDAAPPADRDRLQFLVDHEVAIIDFAHAWRDGGDDPMAPLRAYLDRAACV
ncbi:MAG: hypothetical protein R3D97_06940 [Paracoccaceae bacterium]